MPRGIPNKPKVDSATPHANGATLAPLEATLDDVRVLMETRRAEYQTSADRLSEIIATLVTPKPRIGRPPSKQR